jgi:hypothetical protein
VILRTVTIKTSEGKFKVVVDRGPIEMASRQPSSRSSAMRRLRSTTTSSIIQHASEPNARSAQFGRPSRLPRVDIRPDSSHFNGSQNYISTLHVADFKRNWCKSAKSKPFPSFQKEYTRPNRSRLNDITKLYLTVVSFKESWELIHDCLTCETSTVAELKRATRISMFYAQNDRKFVEPSPKPGKWTWEDEAFGSDLGPEIKVSMLL